MHRIVVYSLSNTIFALFLFLLSLFVIVLLYLKLKQLLKTQSRYHALFQTDTSAILLLDNHGNILNYTPGATKIIHSIAKAQNLFERYIPDEKALWVRHQLFTNKQVQTSVPIIHSTNTLTTVSLECIQTPMQETICLLQVIEQ